jgi:hypothetical protein
MDYYKTSQTVTDLLITFTDRYKASSTHYKLLPPATHHTILPSTVMCMTSFHPPSKKILFRFGTRAREQS